MGTHKRCVFFVRHLAKVPRSTFTAYPGCIVIAAGGLKPVDADASLFSFEDVLRHGVNGLVLDHDAASLRFEERAAASKPRSRCAKLRGCEIPLCIPLTFRRRHDKLLVSSFDDERF